MEESLYTEYLLAYQKEFELLSNEEGEWDDERLAEKYAEHFQIALNTYEQQIQDENDHFYDQESDGSKEDDHDNDESGHEDYESFDFDINELENIPPQQQRRQNENGQVGVLNENNFNSDSDPTKFFSLQNEVSQR